MGEMKWWLGRPLLWFAFAVVSMWLAWQGWVGESVPYGDVSYVYRYWAATAASGGPIVGVDTQWVYPIVAILPIMVSNLFGDENYALSWIALVTAVNAGAFGFLLGKHKTAPSRRKAAWWWLLFMLLLGPIAVARLDSVVTPLAIVGLLFAFTRPALAAVLLTVGAWIKVWPAALVVSVLISARRSWRVLVAAAGTTVAVILTAAAFGAGLNIFSFLGQQSTRGLQIESPWATPFLWMAAGQVPGYSVFYNRDMLTFEVSGTAAEISATAASLLLVVSITAILLIGMIKTKQGVSPLQLLPALALALTIALIVFNKVGSPQYIGWLAAPVVAGLVFDSRRFRIPALAVILTALTTQLFYPYAYLNVLMLQPLALSALSLRNVLELATFVVAIRLLITSKVKV